MGRLLEVALNLNRGGFGLLDGCWQNGGCLLGFDLCGVKLNSMLLNGIWSQFFGLFSFWLALLLAYLDSWLILDIDFLKSSNAIMHICDYELFPVASFDLVPLARKFPSHSTVFL
jgi:hypothetical protein